MTLKRFGFALCAPRAYAHIMIGLEYPEGTCGASPFPLAFYPSIYSYVHIASRQSFAHPIRPRKGRPSFLVFLCPAVVLVQSVSSS